MKLKNKFTQEANLFLKQDPKRKRHIPGRNILGIFENFVALYMEAKRANLNVSNFWSFHKPNEQLTEIYLFFKAYIPFLPIFYDRDKMTGDLETLFESTGLKKPME